MFNRCNNLIDVGELGFDVERDKLITYTKLGYGYDMGVNVDYLVGSPYAVATYYYMTFDKDDFFKTQVALGLLFYELKYTYKDKKHKQGEHVTYTLSNSLTFEEGFPCFDLKQHAKELNKDTVKMFLSRKDSIDSMNYILNKDLKDIYIREKEHLIAAILTEYSKKQGYRKCYRELENIIETYLVKGKVYFNSFNKFLSKTDWLLYDQIEQLPLNSEYNIELKDCRIYSNMGGSKVINPIQKVIQRIDNNDEYEFDYYVRELAHFTSWVCNKINGRSIKRVEQKIMENSCAIGKYALYTHDDVIIVDLCRVIKNVCNLDLYEIIANNEVVINPQICEFNLINTVALTYDVIKYGKKRGYMIDIDKNDIDRKIKQFAKYKLMGKDLVKTFIDIDENWKLKELKLTFA